MRNSNTAKKKFVENIKFTARWEQVTGSFAILLRLIMINGENEIRQMQLMSSREITHQQRSPSCNLLKNGRRTQKRKQTTKFRFIELLTGSFVRFSALTLIDVLMV